MDRIPKYTAGMFKKKMPRFGASSIKKPRLPMPPKPRVKKFVGGGITENEVIVSPETSQKEIPEVYERYERNRKRRELEDSKNFVNQYLAERKKADEAEAKKKAEQSKKKLSQDELRKQFDAYMEQRRQQELREEENFRKAMKQGVKTARSGGKMDSSCCRGDGIAKRGKTRGRMV